MLKCSSQTLLPNFRLESIKYPKMIIAVKVLASTVALYCRLLTQVSGYMISTALLTSSFPSA